MARCRVFTPGDDPGSSFADLLRRIGASADDVDGDATALGALPHATTCVAVRYADGVVMAGDRRATAGNLISHRAMDKVVEADRHSGVAIAGAAGPAMEMVRLFQLQLEHYEKVEGTALSLEGKANQLSMMIRGNLPGGDDGPRRRADLRRLRPAAPGRAPVRLRRHRRALRGAGVRRHGLRQPARRHGDQGRLPRRAWTASGAVDLVCRALWEAADADSATGGPDVLRSIYPIVATITADGFSRRRRRRAAAALRGDRRRRPRRGEGGRGS